MGRALDSTGTFEAQGRSAPRLHVSGLVAKETCAFHEQIVRRTENGKAMLKLLQADHRLTPHAPPPKTLVPRAGVEAADPASRTESPMLVEVAAFAAWSLAFPALL